MRCCNRSCCFPRRPKRERKQFFDRWIRQDTAGWNSLVFDVPIHVFFEHYSCREVSLLVFMCIFDLLTTFYDLFAFIKYCVCRFLGKDRKSAIGVTECSFSNSIIPFFTIPLLYAVVPEYHFYSSSLTGFSQGYTALLFFICLGIALAKMFDRLCKFSLVSETSTMFFASVDCSMKIVAGFGSIIFFHERTSGYQIVGFVLIILSFVPMRYGSHKEKKRIEAQNEAFSQTGSRVTITSVNVRPTSIWNSRNSTHGPHNSEIFSRFSEAFRSSSPNIQLTKSTHNPMALREECA